MRVFEKPKKFSVRNMTYFCVLTWERNINLVSINLLKGPIDTQSKKNNLCVLHKGVTKQIISNLRN